MELTPEMRKIKNREYMAWAGLVVMLPVMFVLHLASIVDWDVKAESWLVDHRPALTAEGPLIDKYRDRTAHYFEVDTGASDYSNIYIESIKTWHNTKIGDMVTIVVKPERHELAVSVIVPVALVGAIALVAAAGPFIVIPLSLVIGMALAEVMGVTTLNTLYVTSILSTIAHVHNLRHNILKAKLEYPYSGNVGHRVFVFLGRVGNKMRFFETVYEIRGRIYETSDDATVAGLEHGVTFAPLKEKRIVADEYMDSI